MLFQKQRMIGMCLALLMLVAFSVNITDAQQSGTNVNLRKSELSGAVRAYNELSAAAVRAFMIHLTDPTNTEALEKSVALSNNFIAEYPTLDRVYAVNYYLGRALVQLGDVETGIATLKKLVEDTQSDRSATTLYVDEIGDRFIDSSRMLMVSCFRINLLQEEQVRIIKCMSVTSSSMPKLTLPSLNRNRVCSL